MELLNKSELDKDRIAVKNNSARALIKAYLKDGRMNTEFKEKLTNILGVLETGNDRGGVSMLKSPALGLDTISEDTNGTTGKAFSRNIICIFQAITSYHLVVVTCDLLVLTTFSSWL